MSKSGFFWNDKKRRFSLIIEQRFKNTSSKPIATEEISKNWMELSSLNEVRLIVFFTETNNFDEINNFFMYSCDVKKNAKKMQVKKESQQNRSRWWIWSRDAAQGILTCLPLLHQKAQGKQDMKVNYLWAYGMSSIKEQGDLFWTLSHQVTQSGLLTRIGLLKSGNLMNWWKLEQETC